MCIIMKKRTKFLEYISKRNQILEDGFEMVLELVSLLSTI